MPLPSGATSPKMIPLEEEPLKLDYGRGKQSGVNWEGFFVGGSVGGAFGDSKWGAASGIQATRNQMPGSVEIRGVNFGGQAGYNWQYGPMVIGGEVSARSGALSGYVNTAKSDATTGNYQVGKAETNMLLNASVRFGYAAGLNLYLMRAGASALNVKYTNDINAIDTTGAKKSGTVYGPSVGLGLERDLGAGFSARVQYDYMRFANKGYAFVDSTAQRSTVSIGQNLHLVTAGIDYRFGAVGDLNGVASPTINQEITGEIGARGLQSKNDYSKHFYNPTTKSQKDAQLDFKDQSFNGFEVFAFLEHDTGVFLKGNLGFGQQSGSGKMRNQDHPPQWTPYSDIRSTTKESRRMTATADVGYQLWRTQNYKVGAFIGVGSINDRVNAYGCHQVATSTACTPTQPDTLIYVTDDHSWHATRLGLRGEATFFDRLRIVGDAVWNPRFTLTSRDNHWLNDAPWDILRGKGSGNNGMQGEVVVNYDITQSLSAGVGGRYTKMTLRKGEANLPLGQAPARYEYSDTTGFLQLSYRFRSDQQK